MKNGLINKNLDFNLASSEEILLELGRRLQLQRLSKNLKQVELAKRAGVFVGTIKNLENKGMASAQTLIRVAIALGLISEFSSLFKLQTLTIADMEKFEQLNSNPKRRRAR